MGYHENVGFGLSEKLPKFSVILKGGFATLFDNYALAGKTENAKGGSRKFRAYGFQKFSFQSMQRGSHEQ